MTDELKTRTNRVNLTIPYSELEVIDRHVLAKLEDGESRDTANRSAFVMEMYRLGLRVYESRKKKGDGEVSLNDQLKFICRNLLITSFLTEAVYHIEKETVDKSKVIKSEFYIDDEFLTMINERVEGKISKMFK